MAEAETSGDRIKGSARYFRAHPGDVGALVHEAVHVVQSYRGGDRPSWLVEGIADHVRFFQFEPGKLGRVDPVKAHFDGGYRTSAAFLDYVARTFDPDAVRKLNQALRDRPYSDRIFPDLTGKTLPELDALWRATLGP